MGQACQSSTSDRSAHWWWAIEPFLICSLNCSLAISDRKFNFKAKIGYPSTTRETRKKTWKTRDFPWYFMGLKSYQFLFVLGCAGPVWPWTMEGLTVENGVGSTNLYISHHDMQQSCKQFECFWWYIATISCSRPALARYLLPSGRMPAAPDKRLRCKTPDPARRHKSPDARSLKKAEKSIKGKNQDVRSGDSTRSSSVDATRKKLTFAVQNKVHRIRAENPPGERRPAQPEPALRKSAKAKMTENEADSILAKFVKDQQEPDGCMWGHHHHHHHIYIYIHLGDHHFVYTSQGSIRYVNRHSWIYIYMYVYTDPYGIELWYGTFRCIYMDIYDVKCLTNIQYIYIYLYRSYDILKDLMWRKNNIYIHGSY